MFILLRSRTMMQRALSISLICLSIVFASACGGGGGSTPAPVITPPTVTVTVSPASASVAAGSTQQFTATVTGSTNTTVSWSVNTIVGGNTTLGTITTAGLYTAPDPLPANTTVTITATSAASATATSASTVQLTQPVYVVSASAAARFLEQSTFGPTPALVSHVRQIGFDAFLTEQFAAAASDYPDQTDPNLSLTQQRFFLNAMNGQDQLRQRVAFALSQIFVISGVTINSSTAFNPYLRILSTDAFGNFYTLMRNVTLSPAMGHYLDMVNNDKPDPVAGTNANENYARELMQLFSIGTVKLNADGTPQLDSLGQPIPTYDQTNIENLARALTGWTYPTKPGSTLQKHNPEYYIGAMVPFESNHDANPKTLLNGAVLPAGQNATQDLNQALQNIFNHANVGPFICKQLIQHLVKSNPSPAYVQRVVTIFNNDGAGNRGNLRAVLRSILLDQEARAGDNIGTANGATEGHLREPMLLILNLLRAFSGASDGANLANQGANMAQRVFYSPTVFNYFSPGFVIPGTTLIGPEFEIFDTSTAIIRDNFVYSFAFGSIGSGTLVDFTPYINMAGNPTQLIDALDTTLMHGQMSTQMRNTLVTALNSLSAASASTRARTAIYLVASSSEFQVQH